MNRLKAFVGHAADEMRVQVEEADGLIKPDVDAANQISNPYRFRRSVNTVLSSALNSR